MAIIKITRGGCGVNLTDANGRERYALKTPEDKPFECGEAQASRLVGLGVAEYVGNAPAEPDDELGTDVDAPEAGAEMPVDDEPEDEPAPTEASASLDKAQLEGMTIEQLKNLAGDIGADVSGCKKKADYIAAIIECEIEYEDDDELPELNAADPE